MLNELLLIERGLVASGVALPDERHPDVKDLGKTFMLRVRLAADGSVDGVSVVDKSGSSRRWTQRDAQRNGFPAVKLQPAKSAVAEETPAESLAEAVFAFVDRAWSPAWAGETLSRRVGERLALLAPLRDDPNTAAVPAVMERFHLAVADPAALLRGIGRAIERDLSAVADKELRKFLRDGGMLYFDVPRDEFPRDVGDPRQMGAISRALSAGGEPGPKGVCCLSGKEVEPATRFPQPNLPLLGQTYLFSKNPDLPAAARYGLIGAEALKVGREAVAQLRSAIETITTPDRRGKTWRMTGCWSRPVASKPA